MTELKDSVILLSDFNSECHKRWESLRWYALDIHYADTGVVIGPVVGNPYGSVEVAATGRDFAEAVANAIRFTELIGHRVDGVGILL